jgi:nucleoside-triphosphatase THEP1
MAAIVVNEIIYQQLKQAYAEKFGSSPSRFITELNAVYAQELDHLRNRPNASIAQDLISDKTLRNFFNAAQSASMRQQYLNYLCHVLLGHKSYQDALRKLDARSFKPLEEDYLQYYQFQLKTDYMKRIAERCNIIQVLDMTEPRKTEEIYAQVKITEDIKSQKQRTIDQLISDLSVPPKVSTSPSLSRSNIAPKVDRLSGLDVAKQYSKLVVLGNAGAGKTTFLKRLAMNFPAQVFEKTLVPIYIELGKFAEDQEQKDLVQAIEQEFDTAPPSVVQGLLKHGHGLILLDGLDEVTNSEIQRVFKSIDQLVRAYPDNRFIITSRVGTYEYQFQGFKQVEMAEFDREQIKEFVKNWFNKVQEPGVGEKFLAQLQKNPPIQELAASPLLLTILCCTFEDGYDLPKNRWTLYEDMVLALSRRWDAHRRINRDVIYPELTRDQIIKMLSGIAYSGFIQEPKRMHWRRGDLEDKIHAFVQEIPSFQPITYFQSMIDLDSISDLTTYPSNKTSTEDYKAILSMIQTNYGLLVAQSKDIYTFSHLSFQEYFSARYVLDRQNPRLLNIVVEQHLSDRQWREVFLVIAGRLADGNELMKQMFQYADKLIQDSEAIQRMLNWLNQVTRTAKVASSSWRMFWLTVDFDIDLYIDNNVKIDRALAQKLSTKMRQFNVSRDKIVLRTPECKIRIYLAVIHALANEYPAVIKGLSPFNKYAFEIDEDYNIQRKLQETIQAVQMVGDKSLQQELEELLGSLPSIEDSTQQWQTWKDSLQRVMLNHLDIGHEVIFSPEDVQALEDYLYVTDLILDCMQADYSSTSKALRDEVVDHILLPSKIIPPHLFPREYN